MQFGVEWNTTRGTMNERKNKIRKSQHGSTHYRRGTHVYTRNVGDVPL